MMEPMKPATPIPIIVGSLYTSVTHAQTSSNDPSTRKKAGTSQTASSPNILLVMSGVAKPYSPTPKWASPASAAAVAAVTFHFFKGSCDKRFVKECTPLDFELLPTLLRNPFLKSNGLDSLRRKNM